MALIKAHATGCIVVFSHDKLSKGPFNNLVQLAGTSGADCVRRRG
jgi:hypothetical protein